MSPLLELQSAARSLRRRPGFAAVCILVLAAGIGSACAVFALVDTVLLRPLPFADPDRLVWIWSARTDRAKAFFSLPNLADTQAQVRTVQVVGFAPWDATLTGRGDPERLQAARVSGAALSLLGVGPAHGRTLTPEDDDPAQAPNAKFTPPRVLPLQEELSGDQARPLLLLLGSVGAVLLLACCNLANLLLVRTAARRQELAVRAALGGTRQHLRRLLLAEAALLAFAGGALGVAFAAWGTDLLAALAPPDLLHARSASFGPRLVAFALACTAVAAVL